MLTLEDVLDVPSFDDEFVNPDEVVEAYDYFTFDW